MGKLKRIRTSIAREQRILGDKARASSIKIFQRAPESAGPRPSHLPPRYGYGKLSGPSDIFIQPMDDRRTFLLCPFFVCQQTFPTCCAWLHSRTPRADTGVSQHRPFWLSACQVTAVVIHSFIGPGMSRRPMSSFLHLQAMLISMQTIIQISMSTWHFAKQLEVCPHCTQRLQRHGVEYLA